MVQANKQQKDIMKQMKIENVDEVIDDIKETQSQMQQVHEAMGQSAVDMDEDELMGECDHIQRTRRSAHTGRFKQTYSARDAVRAHSANDTQPV